MNALDAGIRAEVASGGLTQDEYDLMSIPTWNRTLAEFIAPFDAGGALGLSSWSRSWTSRRTPTWLPPARTTTRGSSGRRCRASCASFTEPSLFNGLARAAGATSTIADRVYARVAEAAAADPEAMETLWHVAVLRIANPA